METKQEVLGAFPPKHSMLLKGGGYEKNKVKYCIIAHISTVCPSHDFTAIGVILAGRLGEVTVTTPNMEDDAYLMNSVFLSRCIQAEQLNWLYVLKVCWIKYIYFFLILAQ